MNIKPEKTVSKSSDVPEVKKVPVKVKEKLPTDIVSVKVLIGTLSFEQGIFEQGAVFQTTRERATKFGSDAQIIE